MAEKKPRARRLWLSPMSFEEAVRRAIEAGPYLAGKEFDEYKGVDEPNPKSHARARKRA